MQYALKTEEAWARAYAQYIATKSGNAAMLAELNAARNRIVDGRYFATQWADEDFEPIMDAIDELFQSQGWIT